MLLKIFTAFILILISGYISAIEIAIASFGKNKIEELKEQPQLLNPFKKSLIFFSVQYK